MFLWPALVVAALAAASPDVTIRWADTHQRITGFGVRVGTIRRAISKNSRPRISSVFVTCYLTPRKASG